MRTEAKGLSQQLANNSKQQFSKWSPQNPEAPWVLHSFPRLSDEINGDITKAILKNVLYNEVCRQLDDLQQGTNIFQVISARGYKVMAKRSIQSMS